MRIVFVHIFVALIFTPLVAGAQEYKPLVPLPGFLGNINEGTGVVNYLNALFNVAILIGSILAVFVIASAGLQYMTTDAIMHKQDSKKRIEHAIFGLIMLLSIWIFFNQINPEILKLKGLDLPKAQTATPQVVDDRITPQVGVPDRTPCTLPDGLGTGIMLDGTCRFAP